MVVNKLLISSLKKHRGTPSDFHTLGKIKLSKVEYEVSLKIHSADGRCVSPDCVVVSEQEFM